MKTKNFKIFFIQFHARFIVIISLFVINKREKIFYLKKTYFYLIKIQNSKFFFSLYFYRELITRFKQINFNIKLINKQSRK